MRFIFILLLTLFVNIINCGTDTISDGGGLETETISNISGTIVNTDGDSVENAVVVATKSDSNNIIISSDTAHTNSDGFYHFGSLDTGLFTFEATKEINNLSYKALIGQYYNDSTDIYLGIDTLKATGFISGNVTTNEITSHYMGIEIYIPGTSFSAHSDSLGNFLMSSVPIGKHLVAFSEPGFNTYTCSTTVEYPGDTAIIPPVVLTSENSTFFSLTGIIVNSSGAAFSDFEVTISKLNNNDSIISASKDTTDNNGNYTFDSLTIGSYIISGIKELNSITYMIQLNKTFSEVKNVDLGIDTIKATGFISGQVTTDDSNSNNAGINVYIQGTSFNAFSDSAGYFILNYVPPGNHHVVFAKTGFQEYSCTLAVFSEETTIVSPVVLISKSDSLFSIFGTIIDPKGSVVNDLEISLNKLDNNDSIISISKDTTDDIGNYLFDSLTIGSYSIIATKQIGNSIYILNLDKTFNEAKNFNLGIDTLKLNDSSTTNDILPPTGLKTSYDSTNSTILISWNTVTSSNLAGYNIYRKIDGENDDKLNLINSNSTVTDTQFIDSISITLSEEITFIYKAKSVDTNNNLSKDFSAQSSITIVPIGDTVFIKMIDLEAGTFIDAPGKHAGVSAFSISETEITLGQFKKFNPTWINLSGTNSDNEPVAGVSLSDCFKFCNWLSKEEGLDTCFIIDTTRKATRVYGDSTYWSLDTSASGYRIPSGDEWEYAAEGGQKYDYATSDNTITETSSPFTSNVWLPFVADDEIQQVKFFEPNPYKLYDMTGNVWEYTWEADYLNKPNGRNNHFDDSETMNDEFIKVRGASAIYPISSPGLSEYELRVDRCHTANSKTQHFFSNKARGFRIVKR